MDAPQIFQWKLALTQLSSKPVRWSAEGCAGLVWLLYTGQERWSDGGEAQDATNIGPRGCRPPATQKGRGTAKLGGVLTYLSQTSQYINDLLCIYSLVYCVPSAYTCKVRELVTLPPISYVTLDPMVSSSFPPKDRWPCYFQGKDVVPCVKRSPWVKRSQSASGEAGTCPTAMAGRAEMIMKGHRKKFKLQTWLWSLWISSHLANHGVFTCPGGYRWTLPQWLSPWKKPSWLCSVSHLWTTEVFGDWLRFPALAPAAWGKASALPPPSQRCLFGKCFHL